MLKTAKIYFPRGDGDSFVIRNIAGKHDDRKVVVSLLESDELTAGLLWQKKNTLAGGSDAEVLVTYDSVRNTSDFEVTLLRDDTEALEDSIYFLSLSSTSTSDDDDHYTPVVADFVLQPSGYGPYTGLPEEAMQFIPVPISDIEDGSFVKRNGDTFDGQDLSTVIGNSHTHSNKTLLDTYTQTEANLADAVSKKHSQNKDTKLDEGGDNEVSALTVKSVADHFDAADSYKLKGTGLKNEAVSSNHLNSAVVGELSPAGSVADLKTLRLSSQDKKLVVGNKSIDKTKIVEFVVGKNLFNKFDIDESGYLGNNNSFTVYASYFSSNYIAVSPSTQYTLSNHFALLYFDEAKKYISGDFSGNNNNPLTFTTPSNCYYVRISLNDSKKDVVQLEAGASSTSYEPFVMTIGGSAVPITLSSLVISTGITKDSSGKIIIDSSYFNKKTLTVDLNTVPDYVGQLGAYAGDTYYAATISPVSWVKLTYEPLSADRRTNIVNAFSKRYSKQGDSLLNFTTHFKDPASYITTATFEYDEALFSKYGEQQYWKITKTSASGITPRLVADISLDDLKRIGIDINDAGYTTQNLSLRLLEYKPLCVNALTSQFQAYVVLMYDDSNELSYSNTNNINLLNGANGTGGYAHTVTLVNNTDWYGWTRQALPLIKEYNGRTLKKIKIWYLVSVNSAGSDTTLAIAMSAAIKGDTISQTSLYLNYPDDLVGVDNYKVDWDSNTTYKKGEKVKFNRNIYISLRSGNLNNTPTDTYYWALDLDFTTLYNSMPSPVADSTQTLTIANADKIAFYGSSYTESVYTVKNHSWVQKLSAFTDLILGNFGVSGNRLVEEVQRLRENSNPFHPIVGIKEFNPTFVSFSNTGNETLNVFGTNLDAFRNEVTLAMTAAQSVGAAPIIGTEHYGYASQELLNFMLSDEYRLLVANIGSVGWNVLRPYTSSYAGFWGGSHPATRTNATYLAEWFYLLSQLRPNKSIKLYRLRSEYIGGSPTIDNLHYDDNIQRLQLFQEISCGEKSLKEENGQNGWEYYDRLDENFAVDSITNEYCKLINNESVVFSKWLLLEAVIDRVNVDVAEIQLSLAASPTKVYIANNNPSSTQYTPSQLNAAFEVSKTVYDTFTESIGEAFTSDATGAAVLNYQGKIKSYSLGGYFLIFTSNTSPTSDAGAGNLTKTSNSSTTAYTNYWNRLSRHKFEFLDKLGDSWSRFEDITSSAVYADGVLTISLSGDILKYFRKDKLRILLNDSGNITLSDLSITYSGGKPKLNNVPNTFKPKPAYTELNSPTGFDSDWTVTDGWTNNGAALEQMPASVRDYPPKHSMNYHVKLDYDATDSLPTSIKKTFAVTSSNGFKKVVVRVIARLFPKIFNTTVAEDDYHTQTRQIKADSYDMGTLVCSIGNGAPYAVSKKPVDIGWSEITFESYIPPYTTSVDVILNRDEFDFIDISNYRNHTYPLQVYDVSVQVEGE